MQFDNDALKKYAIWCDSSTGGFWVYEDTLEEAVTCNASLGEEVEVFKIVPVSLGKFKANLTIKKLNKKEKRK